MTEVSVSCLLKYQAVLKNEGNKYFEKFELQDISCNSNNLYRQLSSNSTYYEETPLYTERSESHIKVGKCIKTTHSKHSTFCPVEIRQESTLSIDLPPISWHKYDCNPKFLNVINTGRTILINGQWTKGRPYITGGPLNGSYIFSQIHFHSPSEHEIDGMRYPLEMHVVHYKTSYLTQERAMQEKDGTVVIVYLFQVQKSNNSFFSCITDSTHLIEGVNSKTELNNIALDQILQPISSNYYIYWGSVSTTKKSYSLQWIISCNKLHMTQKEADKMTMILCAGESFSESQASQMNIINNVIYHVEEYDLTLEEVNCKDDMSKCYCRLHLQECKICTNRKEICLHLSSTETQCSTSKDFSKRHIESQTSSCEKVSKATSRSSLCIYKQQRKKENDLTMPKSMIVVRIPNCNDSDDPKQVVFAEAETSSCPSSEKNIKACVSDKIKKLRKKEKETNRKKVHKCETDSSCATTSSSKSCAKNSKTQHVKRTTKKQEQCEKKCEKLCEKPCEEPCEEPCEKPCEEPCEEPCEKPCEKECERNSRKSCLEKKKADKIEKQKNQKKDCHKSSGSLNSSKSAEVVKQGKKKHKPKNNEECIQQAEIALLPVLIGTSTVDENPFEKKRISVEDYKEERSMDKIKKELAESPAICGKLLKPLKDIVAEMSTCSEPYKDIKTIFENKSDFIKSAPNDDDYAINFLLAPNTLDTKFSPVMTGSERSTEDAQNIDSNDRITVQEFVNKISKTKLSSDKSEEQSKDICFETEHFFRTEKQGDLSSCITQEYNVAVICNHNIIQEFRGTFKPDNLQLGIYEKLHLVPKYPETENFSVRLDDCFVKKETLDQLYIRVKFLVAKVNNSPVETKQENLFEEEIKIPALTFSDLTHNLSYSTEEKTCEPENQKTETKINFNQSDAKNVISKNEGSKVELLKRPDTEPKPSSKNSLQRSLKLKKEEERKENNENEKTDKVVKDLFCKRKKVYFSCEKVEKDENSGRKVFVGSFRTQKEQKTHLAEKKLGPETKPSFLGEKEKCNSSSGKLSKSSIKTKNTGSKKDFKVESSVKSNESDKSNKSKDIITLHKHKPKKSLVNDRKNERKNIELQDGEIISPSEISSIDDVDKAVKLDNSSYVRTQKLSFNKSQTGVKTTCRKEKFVEV